nr:MAG TPA: hypothetical protein [Caudoviricetes sp.]
MFYSLIWCSCQAPPPLIRRFCISKSPGSCKGGNSYISRTK